VKVNELSFMTGGYAGQGVKTVSDTFARICSRAGLHLFVNMEYPSNIKGEHNYIQVMVSEKETGSQIRPVDLLLALDGKTVNMHKDKVAPGGALVYDSEGLEISPVDVGLEVGEIQRDDITVIDIPFLQIAKDVGGSKRMINSIGLGAVLGLLQVEFDALASMLRHFLAKLGDKIIEQNLKGAKRAYGMASENFSKRFGIVLEKREAPDRMLLTGNDAVSMGAIKAGVKFYASYPMTPSSAVLSYLTRRSRDFNMVVLLTEDEISAAGTALGAAHAGCRAMAGTSGGGFCLMSEHLGLAGMAEVPLVIFEGQRPGPATGLPTRTEQGDLKFVLSAHQGDFPRIVVAPGDPPQAFHLTFEAFNLADKYQLPVVILSDKHLGESTWTCEPFDTTGMEIDRGELLSEEELGKIKEYKRYLITESGISPRALPGIPGGVFKAPGNEHTEFGYISEDADVRAAQVEKRARKTASLDVSKSGAKLHGNPEAELTLIGWGSTKPVIIDAMSMLKERRRLSCNFLQVIYMEPFPRKRVTEVLEKAKRTVLVENNSTGQLGDLISEKTGLAPEERILKYNGRQFLRDELADLIEDRL